MKISVIEKIKRLPKQTEENLDDALPCLIALDAAVVISYFMFN